MSLSTILARLVDAEVRFVVVGGVAAVAHGSVRITLDIDLCYDDATDNREFLAGVLADWHAYPREIDPGLPFIMDERTLRTAELLRLMTDLGPIDVMKHVPGVGDYEACRAWSRGGIARRPPLRRPESAGPDRCEAGGGTPARPRTPHGAGGSPGAARGTPANSRLDIGIGETIYFVAGFPSRRTATATVKREPRQ